MQTPVKKRLCADDPASAEKTARCTERRGVDLSSDHCVAIGATTAFGGSMGSMVDFNCRFYILDQRNSDQQLGEFVVCVV